MCVCLCVYERPVGSGFLVLKRGKTSAPGFPTLHRTTMLYVRMFQFVLKSRGHKTDTDTDTDTHTHTDTDTHTQADRQTDTRTRTQTQAHAHIHAQQVALTPSLQPQSASWRLQPCLRSSRLYFCFVVCLFVCLVNVCFVLVFSSLSLTQTHAHSHSLFVTCVCAARNWRSRAETRGTKAKDKNHNTDT